MTLTFSQQYPGEMLPVKVIPLTRGKLAIIDPEDFALAGRCKWYAHEGSPRSDGRWYAQRKESGTHRTVSMHFSLTGYAQTDHRNGNGLDNRRGNLRDATTAQNIANRGKLKNNTTGFKGVSWHKGRWEAAISHPGRPGNLHLGRFMDKEDAARAYDAAARERWGEFARLNFPGGT